MRSCAVGQGAARVREAKRSKQHAAAEPQAILAVHSMQVPEASRELPHLLAVLFGAVLGGRLSRRVMHGLGQVGKRGRAGSDACDHGKQSNKFAWETITAAHESEISRGRWWRRWRARWPAR